MGKSTVKEQITDEKLRALLRLGPAILLRAGELAEEARWMGWRQHGDLAAAVERAVEIEGDAAQIDALLEVVGYLELFGYWAGDGAPTRAALHLASTSRRMAGQPRLEPIAPSVSKPVVIEEPRLTIKLTPEESLGEVIARLSRAVEQLEAPSRIREQFGDLHALWTDCERAGGSVLLAGRDQSLGDRRLATMREWLEVHQRRQLELRDAVKAIVDRSGAIAAEPALAHLAGDLVELGERLSSWRSSAGI